MNAQSQSGRGRRGRASPSGPRSNLIQAPALSNRCKHRHRSRASLAGFEWLRPRFEGSRAEALGIQNLAEHGVQGRGVMIDLHAHFGRKRHAVGFDDAPFERGYRGDVLVVGALYAGARLA